MTLTIVATINALPEHRHEVLTALTNVVSPTRNESGCLQYDLHVDQGNPNRMVMIECWSDEASLDAHIASSHLHRLKETIRDKVECTSMLRLAPFQ